MRYAGLHEPKQRGRGGQGMTLGMGSQYFHPLSLGVVHTNMEKSFLG